MTNCYYSVNEQGLINNIVLFESNEQEIVFDGIAYYLNTNNLQIGQTVNYNIYETVKVALDGRLKDTDFWELPSVQEEASNAAELIAYRKVIRELRIQLNSINFLEIYDQIPEKPDVVWGLQ